MVHSWTNLILYGCIFHFSSSVKKKWSSMINKRWALLDNSLLFYLLQPQLRNPFRCFLLMKQSVNASLKKKARGRNTQQVTRLDNVQELDPSYQVLGHYLQACAIIYFSFQARWLVIELGFMAPNSVPNKLRQMQQKDWHSQNRSFSHDPSLED